MKVSIYVAMHKPDNYVLLLEPYPIYKPIYCGNLVTPGGYIPQLRDNTGDNISIKNPHYCELTAMYWAWKNDNESDIIGLNHYRRYFAEPQNLNELLKKETITSLLKNNDFLVNGCNTDYDDTKNDNESVFAQYKMNHNIQDLNIALDGVKTLYPTFYTTISNEIYHSGAMCVCNMLITTKQYFNEYCEFLFSVLNYVEKHINLQDDRHQGYNGRVFGFLGERLFRPWLIAKGYKGIQVPELNWEQYSGYIWE